MKREQFRVEDGRVENLKIAGRVVGSAPKAVMTGVKIFDDNLSSIDLVLLESALSRSRDLGSFEVVQNILSTASEEDMKVLSAKVGDLKYCVDDEARNSVISSILSYLNGM